jgi:hypothetical protein
MTRQFIRRRRWLKNPQSKKVIIKTEKRHHFYFIVPPINFFKWWERLKSIFNFSKYEDTNFIIWKGRKFLFHKDI